MDIALWVYYPNSQLQGNEAGNGITNKTGPGQSRLELPASLHHPAALTTLHQPQIYCVRNKCRARSRHLLRAHVSAEESGLQIGDLVYNITVMFTARCYTTKTNDKYSRLCCTEVPYKCRTSSRGASVPLHQCFRLPGQIERAIAVTCKPRRKLQRPADLLRVFSVLLVLRISSSLLLNSFYPLCYANGWLLPTEGYWTGGKKVPAAAAVDAKG